MNSNDFNIFWKLYGKKRNRMDAEQAWQRLTDKEQRAAVRGIADYRKDCRRKDVAMVYAQRYLSERLWEKDPAKPAKHPRTAKQQPRPLFDTTTAAPPDPETW